MTALTRALSAETLKLNRTLALMVALALPMVVILINFFMLMRMTIRPDFEGWSYFLNNNMGIWGVLMMPLYITLETALLGSLEHNHQGWKHLFALPIPRGAIYASKQIIAFGMVGLSMVVLIVMTYLSAWLARALNINPEATFGPGFDWPLALKSAGMLYLLSFLIISLHTWVALRFSSFTLASIVGISATVMSYFIINDETLIKFFPWSLPINAMSFLTGREADLSVPLAVSLTGALLVSIIGGWDVTRKDVL